MRSQRITDMPGMVHLWKVNNLFLAGQPAPETLDALKEAGVNKVINIRGQDEAEFEWEIEGLKERGIDYEHLPIMGEKGLDGEVCEKISNQINDKDTFFIHCASANRVGAWLITYLVDHRGFDFESAVDLAMNAGLSNPGFVGQAQNIVKG